MDPPREPERGLTPAFEAPVFQHRLLHGLMQYADQLFIFLVALLPLVKAVTHDARLLLLDVT